MNAAKIRREMAARIAAAEEQNQKDVDRARLEFQMRIKELEQRQQLLNGPLEEAIQRAVAKAKLEERERFLEIKERHETHLPTVYKFKFNTLRKQCQDFQNLFNHQLAEQKMIESLPQTPPYQPQAFQETEQGTRGTNRFFTDSEEDVNEHANHVDSDQRSRFSEHIAHAFSSISHTLSTKQISFRLQNFDFLMNFYRNRSFASRDG